MEDSTTQFTTKHTARQILLQKIHSYVGNSVEKQEEFNQIFVDRLLPVLEKFKSIGIYDPLSHEPNLLRSLPILFLAKKIISFPWFDDTSMKFLQIFHLDIDLIPHPKFKTIRIPDPHLSVVTPDVILIPGIGYTKKKYRLGTGKGLYDRFLATPKNRALTIGCFYSCSLCEFPYAGHDIPLDIIVTEKSYT